MTKHCRFFSNRAETEANVSAQQIARAAARLFAAQGYDGTPVRAICEAAGVTKPTLYYHFGNKEGLAKALLTDPLTAQLEELAKVIEGEDDPLALLAKTFELHFRFFRDDPDRGRFLYAIWFGPLASGLSSELAHFASRFDECMYKALRKLADAGVIHPDRVSGCFMACKGQVVVRTLDFLYQGAALGPDLPGLLVHDLIHGFGTDQGLGVSSASEHRLSYPSSEGLME